MAWREEILREARETLQHLQAESENHPDLADRASSETDRAIELRARDRQRKLIAKIDAALGRLEDGTYGYCEETGEPIALKRLQARPIATLSIQAPGRREGRGERFNEGQCPVADNICPHPAFLAVFPPPIHVSRVMQDVDARHNA